VIQCASYAESKVQRRRSFMNRKSGLGSYLDRSNSPKNISIALSPSALIHAYTKFRLSRQHATEADCSSATFAGASTRITQPRLLDHAGARAQSPDQEGLLLANLQRTKACSLQRKCPTEQHPSSHPPSCLVLDWRCLSHHLWLKSPHLEPRSPEC